MNIEELFAGIGVVIDDKVFSSDEEGDRIVKIIKELETVRKFPLVKYADLPDDDVLTKLTNVSFLLLDWEIEPKQDDLGEEAPNVQLGDVLKADNEKRVIEIVKETLRNSLVPVFIFSNQDIETIKKKLLDADVDLTKSQIFIKSKSELVEDEALFNKIGEWVDGVSGVYVAKAWDNAFNKAKNQFFATMCNNTSHWPKALFNAATEDSTEPGEEITQAISQNVISRMQPIEIDLEQIEKDTMTPSKEEILGIMKGQFFLDKGVDSSMVGDFFKKKSGEFYMNIRPTCDCIEGREKSDGRIYLLRCSRLSDAQVARLYLQNDGHFNETIGCAIVGPLYENKFYRVDFGKVEVAEVAEWKEKKVGRILPPIINHITERYSLYVQRQALPRIPKEIIPEIAQEDKDKEQKPGCVAALLKPVFKKK